MCRYYILEVTLQSKKILVNLAMEHLISRTSTLTCIMRMSKRPTKRVTETIRSNAVLNKSADVLYKWKLRMTGVFCWCHLEYNLVQFACKTAYPEYQGTMSRKSGFISLFSFSSSKSVDGWVSVHLKWLRNMIKKYTYTDHFEGWT